MAYIANAILYVLLYSFQLDVASSSYTFLGWRAEYSERASMSWLLKQASAVTSNVSKTSLQESRYLVGNARGVKLGKAAALLLAMNPSVRSQVARQSHTLKSTVSMQDGPEPPQTSGGLKFAGQWPKAEVKEVSINALPKGKVAGLKQLYGAPSRFLEGKHGITHFCFKEPTSKSSNKARIAVLSHGLGANSNLYDGSIRKSLLNAGFRVLSYDFLDHGWSHANVRFLRYDKSVFLESLNELLDHVLEPGESIDLWIGHSTGGVVGVLAATSEAHPIQQLVLISPAFRTVKPAIARMSDKIPKVMHTLVKKVSPLKVLPQNAYLKNNEAVFAKKEGQYLFPDKQAANRYKIKRMFKLNPQAVDGILGISLFFLREDLLSDFREQLKEIVAMTGPSVPRICLIWGKYDAVTPFETSTEILSWGAPGRVKVVALEAGHESPVEVPDEIAEEILKFLC